IHFRQHRADVRLDRFDRPIDRQLEPVEPATGIKLDQVAQRDVERSRTGSLLHGVTDTTSAHRCAAGSHRSSLPADPDRQWTPWTGSTLADTMRASDQPDGAMAAPDHGTGSCALQ